MAKWQEIFEEQEKVDELIELAYEAEQSGSIDKALDLYAKAWDLYPEPKEKWTEAYNTAKYIHGTYMDIKNYPEAKKWLNQMIKDNNINHDYHGELEFMIGKYKYETGSYEEALEYFRMATKEGGGMRYFEDEDKKYREFYKNPEKTLAGSAQEVNKTQVKPEKDSEAVAELDDDIYDRITELSDEGNELAEEGDFEAAAAKFSEALELIPAPKTDWEAAMWLYASIGDMYYFLGSYEAAANSLFDALNCPDGFMNPFVHLRLGESLYELGRAGKAKEHLLQAYMLEGKDIFADEDTKYFNSIRVSSNLCCRSANSTQLTAMHHTPKVNIEDKE